MSWDDGKHQKVKSVQLTFDDVIRSIQVEYHGTTLQSQQRGTTVGPKSDGFTLSLDEYITEVSGYYKTTFSGEVITSLTFKTNKKTYGPYGNKTQNSFSAFAPSGNQIAGFLGNSGDALNSIDVHFAPIPPPGTIKPEPDAPETKPGGDSETKPGGDSETKPGGDSETKPSGDGETKPGGDGETKPGGDSETKPGGDSETKPGGDSETKPGGDSETKPGGDSETKPGGDPSKPDGSVKKGPVGGEKGITFDDGTFDGVKKVTVAADTYSITYVKIEYVRDGRVETREHGTIRGESKEFTVDYPNDNIVAVGGSYDHIFNYNTTLITSLYFTTSKGFTSPKFGETQGTEFKLEDTNGGKLVGFHGRGGHAIDAIGAHFGTTSGGSSDPTPGDSTSDPSGVEKLEAQGGKGGNQWDDGSDHDGVVKIYVAAGGLGVENIKFDYVKNGETKEGPSHGVKARAPISTFEISHPDEHLIAVEGWFDSSNIIQGIQFKTDKKSESFGYEFAGDGTQFSLQAKDKKIVGFHGFADSHVNSLGAYFAPISATILKPAKKLQAVGGDEGTVWDDGIFDGVKKVHVGQDLDGVSYVTFEYNKGSQTIIGDGHGKKSLLDPDTFELEYPSEYITAVGVYYERLQGEKAGMTVVSSLIFKTNKRTSPPFGVTSGDYVELKEEGHKIVGFHGKASDYVHQVGVYVAPIIN